MFPSTLSSTFNIMGTMHMQCLKLPRPAVEENIQVLEMWQTDSLSTDDWYEINIPFFLKKKLV